MFPTKSMIEYMQEIDRLFPETRENDIPDLHYHTVGPFSNCQSPRADQSLNYPLPMNSRSPNYPASMANQSSSSADSMSPDTFPDITQRTFETPYIPRGQRPIIGRKICGTSEPPRLNAERPVTRTFENFDLNHLKEFIPYNHATKSDELEANFRQNYELFPMKYDLSLKSPLKAIPIRPSFIPSPTNVSSNLSTYSPSKVQGSPPRQYISMFAPNVDPRSSQFCPDYPSSSTQNYRQMDMSNPSKMCTFCRKNGETPVVYMTHTVKSKVGNKNVVSCPILRSHVCTTCGSSGDDAHTITYCPVLRRTNNGLPLQSTTITLKNTRIKSNGRRRY